MGNSVSDNLIESFKEMLKIEKSMEATYELLIQMVKNKEIKAILRGIRDDERKHEANVNEILAILGRG